MAKIYKYSIPEVGVAFVLKIKGFQDIVHVGEDGNRTPCIWAQVDPGLDEESWPFLVVGTGQEFDADKWYHVRSFVQANGLVWHLLRPMEWIKPESKPATAAAIVYIVAKDRPEGISPSITDEDVVRIFFTKYEDAKNYIQEDYREDLKVYSVFAITQQKVTFDVPF